MKKAIAMCLIACMVMTGCGGSKGRRRRTTGNSGRQ